MYAIAFPQTQVSSQHRSKADDYLMLRESERLKTYKNWTNFHVSPQELARNGFYALGVGGDDDNVQCAFCNVQINQWQEQDDVMSEHFRWSKHCPLLLGVRCGNVPVTITTVPIVTANPMSTPGQDTCGSSCRQVRPNSCAEDADPDPGINLSKLGVQMSETPAYPPFATREKREASFAEWPRSMRQTPRQLAEAGFFYNGKGDQTICFHCGGGLKDWEDADDPWEQHAKWFSRCAFLRLHKSAEYIAEVRRDVEDEEEPGPTDTVATSTAASLNIKPVAPATTPAAPETATKEPEDLENTSNRTLCKICFTNDVGVVFLPCGHIVACVDCAPALSTCAVCRKPLQATVRAFLS